MQSITPRPLTLLVLGGTRFVGRTLVETALAEGHHGCIRRDGPKGPPAVRCRAARSAHPARLVPPGPLSMRQEIPTDRR